MVSDKGKKPAGKSSGKRKVDEDKTGGARKRRNRGVLQFVDDAAAVSDGDDYSSGDSIFDDDFFEEEDYDLGTSSKNAHSKPHSLPFFPKEEQIEEEIDKMLEERYRNPSQYLRFAEDEPVLGSFGEKDYSIPSTKDPATWKVKCAVGRERLSAFCLMQKFVDLKAIGKKMHIVSAYAVEHMKGRFFVEAEKQSEVTEACKGLCSVYATRVTPVPRSEVPHLLKVQNRRAEISPGTWARVKSGTYKGDLTLVVAVNDAKRRATVQLIPRIDLQALAEKFGGGISLKKTGKRAGPPAPKLISASELEEFRPLIQIRHDRDVGDYFEYLDGLMFRKGYLFKRVAIDSLNFWGVMPSEEEQLKFKPPENNESSEVEWLTQLYGDKKKKGAVKYKETGEKGEGSSCPSSTKSYDLFDLVCIGRKDFGLVVGIEKDDYKILKEGVAGHIVQNVGVHEITNKVFDGKFTAIDQHGKPISVNENVRIMEGPLKDRQGIIKQIYRGMVFIYDDNELENGGYICSRAQQCEKIKLSADSFNGKGGEPSQFGFDEPPPSPKSPLSPEKTWQARENRREFNQGEREGFSVGQTLRIRVGPLKGYTCRVIGVRRSDVTVKLDSRQKVLTVKSDHLTEVHGRSSASSFREDPDSVSSKPFDLLGNEGSTDWTSGAGASATDGGWNSGGSSAPWSSWSGVPTSGVPSENNSSDPSGFQTGSKQDLEDGGWGSKAVPKQNSSWATSTADNQVGSGNDKNDGWGNSSNTWNKAAAKGSASGSGSDSWGKATLQSGNLDIPSEEGKESWNNAAAVSWGKASDADENNGWNKQKSSVSDGGSDWNSWNRQGGSSGGVTTDNCPKGGDSCWSDANQKMKASDDSSCDKTKNDSDNWTKWKKSDSSSEKGKDGFSCDAWTEGVAPSDESKDKSVSGFEQDGKSSWNKDGASWKKQDEGCSWGTSASEIRKDGDCVWNKPNSGSWNKPDAGASHNKDGRSSWGKIDEDPSGSKQDGGSWNSQTGGSKQNVDGSWSGGDGGSCSKQDVGSSWNKSVTGSDDAGGSSWNKQGGSWNKSATGSDDAGGSSWNKQGGSWNKSATGSDDAGGSSWNKQGGPSWGQGDGGSSWSQQSGSTFRDRGNEQETFGGYGGRRGRGGRGDRSRGGRGDRGRFGWGRASDHDQSSGYGGNGGQRGGGRFGERSSWSSNPESYNNGRSWGKTDNSIEGGNYGGTSGSSEGWKRTEGDSWGKKNDYQGDNDLGKASDSSGGWKKPEGDSWGKKNEDSRVDNNWGNSGGSSGGWKKPEGDSWSKKNDFQADNDLSKAGDSSGGWKKPEGDSWGKKNEDSGAGNKWGNSGDSSGSWKKPEGAEGDSWGKKTEDSRVDNNWGNSGGSSGGWKKPEGDSWSKKNDFQADNDLSKAGDSSGRWKKPEGDSWGKKNEDSGAGNKWGNSGDSSGGWKKPEGDSWGKKTEDAGGSSWNAKPDGGGGDSSWGIKPSSGGSSWGSKKQDGGDSSWKAGGSSWNSSGGREEEGSGGGWKAGGGSLWNSSEGRGEEWSGGGWKAGGGSSWNNGGPEGSQGNGGGGYRRDNDQTGGGGRGGRGSWGDGGGRWGRGGFGRGGRDQSSGRGGGRYSYGSGRGQGQQSSSGWGQGQQSSSGWGQQSSSGWGS